MIGSYTPWIYLEYTSNIPWKPVWSWWLRPSGWLHPGHVGMLELHPIGYCWYTAFGSLERVVDLGVLPDIDPTFFWIDPNYIWWCCRCLEGLHWWVSGLMNYCCCVCCWLVVQLVLLWDVVCNIFFLFLHWCMRWWEWTLGSYCWNSLGFSKYK